MTDVVLLENDTSDGGEITCVGGVVLTDEGVSTAAYISLFGGNQEDSGNQEDDAVQFWGNLLEEDTTRHIRSRFGYLVDNLPATTANLARLKAAAESDVAWMASSDGPLDEVTVTLSVPAPKRIEVEVAGTIWDRRFVASFTRDWT